MKRIKGFLMGVVVTALALAGAAHFGFVKIDITVTDKGQAVLNQAEQVLDSAQQQATDLYSEHVAGEQE